jgi:SAM-dependent methyltransferase
MNKVRAEDQEAARTLGISEHRLSLAKIARENNWNFQRGASLACGSGRAERQLIKLGVCKSFLGVDIAPAALEEARRLATEGNYDIEYREADLNKLSLPPNAFDLVVTQNCLHHVLELEYLAEQIWRALKPDGYVWIDDFVGETQFQWTDKRLTFVNRILDALPQQYRTNAMTGKPVGPYARRPPGQLGSPFEAIRSGEIVQVFERFFETKRRKEFGTILHLVTPTGTRNGFAASQQGRELFRVLQELDELLVDTATLPPLGGQYLMQKKDVPSAAHQDVKENG